MDSEWLSAAEERQPGRAILKRRRSGGSSSESCVNQLIKAADAAEVLALSPRTLWSLTNCEAIPSRRVGRAVRYVPAELDAWIVAGCPTEPGAGRALRIRRSA
ncbi:helix-turn-helix domain-containing protein [Planctomycetes bacterium Poly30]|uniref:helix-turn-helix domain-containing protein n=1 Tax=Saltatorellus ferox TaxID=2528018 RepID=UPI00119D7F29